MAAKGAAASPLPKKANCAAPTGEGGSDQEPLEELGGAPASPVSTVPSSAATLHQKALKSSEWVRRLAAGIPQQLELAEVKERVKQELAEADKAVDTAVELQNAHIASTIAAAAADAARPASSAAGRPGGSAEGEHGPGEEHAPADEVDGAGEALASKKKPPATEEQADRRRALMRFTRNCGRMLTGPALDKLNSSKKARLGLFEVFLTKGEDWSLVNAEIVSEVENSTRDRSRRTVGYKPLSWLKQKYDDPQELEAVVAAKTRPQPASPHTHTLVQAQLMFGPSVHTTTCAFVCMIVCLARNGDWIDDPDLPGGRLYKVVTEISTTHDQQQQTSNKLRTQAEVGMEGAQALTGATGLFGVGNIPQLGGTSPQFGASYLATPPPLPLPAVKAGLLASVCVCVCFAVSVAA